MAENNFGKKTLKVVFRKVLNSLMTGGNEQIK